MPAPTIDQPTAVPTPPRADYDATREFADVMDDPKRCILTRLRDGSRKYYGVYSCECGGQKEIYDYSVRRGLTLSCGCVSRANVIARNRTGMNSRTHGQHKTRTYRIWSGMIDRCTNPNAPNYDNYGGRGIAVCKEWQHFENFLADMGHVPDGMSIEREDNSRGYEPENCRWATQAEQLRNTRRNHKITYNGRTQCLMDWAKELGIHPATLRNRLVRAGDSVEVAFRAVNRKGVPA